jgi:hypothetical protein
VLREPPFAEAGVPLHAHHDCHWTTPTLTALQMRAAANRDACDTKRAASLVVDSAALSDTAPPEREPFLFEGSNLQRCEHLPPTRTQSCGNELLVKTARDEKY